MLGTWKHPGCRSPVALTSAEEITCVVVRLEVGSDRFGGHSGPVTHLDPLRSARTDGLRLSGGCTMAATREKSTAPRCPSGREAGTLRAVFLPEPRLAVAFENRCLGRGLGCRGPLGRRFLGSLRRRRPRPRVHPSGTRRRPVARRVRRFAAGARSRPLQVPRATPPACALCRDARRHAEGHPGHPHSCLLVYQC